MTASRGIHLIALAFLLLGSASRAEGQEQSLLSIGGGDGDQPITVDADSITYDRPKETIEADGDVMITSGSSVLAADRVSINRGTGEAEASGSVLIEDPEARVSADRAWMELDDETGYLVDGEVHLRRSRFLLSGARLEKGTGQSYRIWDGELTTCLCDEGAPDWSISGDQVDISLGGWGAVRSGLLKVKDVPILYFPYGIFPVRRERQSGFLFPRFDISSARGFQYVQPYYWEIDKSSDATISLDVETAARIGILGEYRYALSPTGGGIMTATYFNEHIGGDRSEEVVDPQDIEDPSVPENRWSVMGYHQSVGPWQSRLYAQPFYVSDNLFLRDMNVLDFVPSGEILLSTRRFTKSELGMVKVDSWGMFKAEAQWFQDLIEKQSRIPQPVPRFTLQLRTRLFDQLRLGLNSEAVYYYRAPLASGPRLDLAPEASLPYRVGPYGFGTFRLILRETDYYLVNNDIPIGFEQANGTFETKTVNRFQHREMLQFTANFSSELARVFEVQRGDLLKVKHTIEPYLQYNFNPLVNQDDLPFYDFIDRINARNLITYGISTRLLGKFGEPEPEYQVPPGEVEGNPLVGDELYGPAIPAQPATRGSGQIRELARAYVQQSYEISRPIFFSADFEPQQLSGIDAGLRLTPADFFGLNGRAVYSVADRKLVYTEAGARLFDPRPIRDDDQLMVPGLRPVNSISAYYQFNSGGSIGNVEVETLRNVNVASTLRLTDHLALSYLGRIDALVPRFLENYGGIRIISECDCWVLDLAVVDRINPDELEVRFRVSLVGLGSFGQSPFADFGNFFAPLPSASGGGSRGPYDAGYGAASYGGGTTQGGGAPYGGSY